VWQRSLYTEPVTKEAVRIAETDGYHVNVRCWLHDAPSVQADVSGPFLSKAQPITTFLTPAFSVLVSLDLTCPSDSTMLFVGIT
jgi:hypothetical protein